MLTYQDLNYWRNHADFGTKTEYEATLNLRVPRWGYGGELLVRTALELAEKLNLRPEHRLVHVGWFKETHAVKMTGTVANFYRFSKAMKAIQ